MKLSIKTDSKQQIVDITEQVQAQIKGNVNGVVIVAVLHTTCALTTADLDPGTDLDFLDFLNGIIPNVKWRHPHNPEHAPAHLLSSLIGPSVSIPIENGQLQLGSWQRIILAELDGPRERNLDMQILTGKK